VQVAFPTARPSLLLLLLLVTFCMLATQAAGDIEVLLLGGNLDVNDTRRPLVKGSALSMAWRLQLSMFLYYFDI